VNPTKKLPGTKAECLRELGCPLDADTAAIKRHWRHWTQVHHPDKGGDAEMFHRVTHAYRFLTNPEYKMRWEHAETHNGNPDYSANLDMILTMPISFDDAFFGKTFVCTFNIQSFDDAYTVNPLASGHLPLQTVTITVPPGMMKETRIHFNKMGHVRGELRGKAIALVRPQDHEKFSMEGNIISSKEEISIDLMIRGGKFEAETMRGLKKVMIPPASLPGDFVDIKDAGLDTPGGRLAHRMYITPRFPTQEELKTKKSWRRFKIRWSQGAPEQPPTEQSKPGQAVYRLGSIFGDKK
jgi:DnaJ-class molecular chaperone